MHTDIIQKYDILADSWSVITDATTHINRNGHQCELLNEGYNYPEIYGCAYYNKNFKTLEESWLIFH